MKMKKIRGISASKGYAIGTLALCVNIADQIEKKTISDTAAEVRRIEAARDGAIEDLNEIYIDALKRVGEEDSMIFQIHIMMLQDDDFFDAIKNRILEESVNAEYAVQQAAKQFSEMFSEMDDEYMRGRAADVVDISRRLLRGLNPLLGNSLEALDHEAIVAAADLMPSETIQMDKSKVLAFVTREGSKSSHSAILARTIGIPAVVGLGAEYTRLEDGAVAIVDGGAGEILVDPDEQTLREYREKQEEFRRLQEELQQLKGTKAVTKSGRQVAINANIGSPEDVEAVLQNDADGIGLFRSEFLYMNGSELPTEDQQAEAYKKVLEAMDGKQVIIRTLDIGADKKVPYLNLPPEENPAMGYRAIRICLDRRELFLTQLRALVRASSSGNLGIMFPMITSVEEVREAKKLIDQAAKELEQEGIISNATFEIGIMIETPASVMLSEELAKEVDFFSIGTNDLTQYTLAVDRMNPKIEKMYDPRHPAVLRMIEKTVQSAKAAGIWVGICGESAADTELTEFYVQIGVDELSVAPSSVLELKRKVQQL